MKNKITAGPDMKVARYDCPSVLLPSGNLMIFGGYGAVTQSQPLRSTEIYNVTLRRWASAPPPMLVARAGASATGAGQWKGADHGRNKRDRRP